MSWQQRQRQAWQAHLIPLHGMLEGLHGKVHLADVLVLHKDAQVHLAAGAGCEAVLAVCQVTSYQSKEVARLFEGVLPNSKMPAPCQCNQR